jgi:hypothetical protein
MHCFLLICFDDKPLHVSSRLVANHQEDQLCINSKWYSHALCWLATVRVNPPHDEQQACSKHVEAYHRNKLVENSASCLFILYGYNKNSFCIWLLILVIWLRRKNIFFCPVSTKKQTLSVRRSGQNPSTVTIIMHSQPTSRQLTKRFYWFDSFSIRPGQQNTASFQHLMYKDLPTKYRLLSWHICPVGSVHDSEQSYRRGEKFRRFLFFLNIIPNR